MPQSLRSRQLALLSGAVLDIPRRTRWVIFTAALTGIGLVVMGSLFSGGQEAHIQTDKLIHFSGYTLLSFLLVVALRPILFIPGLLALIGIGATVEFLQGMTGRSTDFQDAMANSLGVFVGASAGLIGRAIFVWLRTEIIEAQVRKKLEHHESGDVVFRQGERSDEFYVVKSGSVRVDREADGGTTTIGTVGAGELLGFLGVIRGEPNYTTAVVVEDAVLFPMTAAEVLPGKTGEGSSAAAPVIEALSENLVRFALRLEEAGVELTDRPSDA
ncbi:MAG: cyclic nucleotide-binding domain-containing protein [Planctomycetota bacterium]